MIKNNDNNIIISCVFSLDMLGSGDYTIVKFTKDDKEEINNLLDNYEFIMNSMCSGDATTIVESFLGRILPIPSKNYNNFSEFKEMLFITLSGMNLKTQHFDKYEPWMGIKFFYIKRK